MFIRRIIAVAVVLAAFCHGIALAAEGHQAKFTITAKFGDEYFKRMAKATGQKLEEIQRSNFDLSPVNGILYFTPSCLRMDLQVGQGIGILTEIVDQNSKEIILVNHATQSAWRMSYEAMLSQYRQMGLPVTSPEKLFFSWEDAQSMIEAIPGATVSKLGQQQLAGQPCHGLRFKADLAKMVKAQGISALPNQPAVTDLSGPWMGEIWIADKLGLPMKLTTQMIGMDYTWEITEVNDWKPIAALLAIPPGYHVEEVNLMDQSAELPGV